MGTPKPILWLIRTWRDAKQFLYRKGYDDGSRYRSLRRRRLVDSSGFVMAFIALTFCAAVIIDYYAMAFVFWWVLGISLSVGKLFTFVLVSGIVHHVTRAGFRAIFNGILALLGISR